MPWPAHRVVRRRISSRSTEVTAELAPICNASQSALSDACVSWHPDERPLNSFPCPGEAKGTNQCAWRRLRGLLFCMAAPAREWSRCWRQNIVGVGMIAAGYRLLSWTLWQRCCAGDPPSQVPHSRCTSSLATISGFLVAQGSRCARPCAVSMARRSWWRSRSIGECLEPHSPLPVPYRGRAVGVI